MEPSIIFSFICLCLALMCLGWLVGMGIVKLIHILWGDHEEEDRPRDSTSIYD